MPVSGVSLRCDNNDAVRHVRHVWLVDILKTRFRGTVACNLVAQIFSHVWYFT